MLSSASSRYLRLASSRGYHQGPRAGISFFSSSWRAAPCTTPRDFSSSSKKEDENKTDIVRFENNKPTLDYAKAMPRDFSGMPHEVILQLCVEGVYEARKEALIRNVMTIDSIDYDAAVEVVEKISKSNRNGMALLLTPYHMGLMASAGAGIISFPMIFDYDTVKWFNEVYVSADVPEPKDLETWLEVGSWSWGWMEPVIGQVSFVLLIMQLARNQMMSLGLRPFGNFVKEQRAKSLVKKYPQYDEVFLRWYAKSDTLYNSSNE